MLKVTDAWGDRELNHTSTECVTYCKTMIYKINYYACLNMSMVIEITLITV